MIDATPVFSVTDKTDVAVASVDTNNVVEINWQAYPGTTSYNLYRYMDNDTSTTSLVAQTPATSYPDNTVSPSAHSYTYYIQAQDGCGHFTSHGRVGKTIKLSGFENGDLLPQLVWTPYKDWSGGVSNYEILREDPGNGFKNIGNAKDTGFEDAMAAGIYGECYRVMASSNDTGQLSFSNVFCFSNSPQIFIPNIFTPNGDSLNEVFAPVCMGIKSWDMTIINRWGEKVYTYSSPSESLPAQTGQGEAGWDGRFKGIVCPNGVYVYYINAEDFNGNAITKQGMVMLQQ